MSTKKRRIIVEFTGVDENESTRYAIPMNPESTIATLADEVIRRHGLSQQSRGDLQLSLQDSSILNEGDDIQDVVEPGEIVYVRQVNQPSTGILSSSSLRPYSAQSVASTSVATLVDGSAQHIVPQIDGTVDVPMTSSPAVDPRSSALESDNLKRIKIALITPESGRNGGDKEPKKVMAFGNSSVSVNLPMVSYLSCCYRLADSYPRMSCGEKFPDLWGGRVLGIILSTMT